MSSLLKFGIPKGSLEEATVDLFGKAGWRITTASRSYFPSVDDEEMKCSLIRCLLYTSPSPRDGLLSRMPSSA